MPNIVYNGEFGVEPHFSSDLFTKPRLEQIEFIDNERTRVLADRQAFEQDLNADDPELRYGAEVNIDVIDKKAEKLQLIIDALS